MANTLKFGNGEWYGKEDTILAYNDERNNIKPLPFDYERGSVATRVNKEGLIETVGANEPRVDYKDDVKGALLLEPSRTNLIPYSSNFSAWSTASGASVVGNKLGVGGSNDAFEFFSDGSASTRLFYSVSVTGSSSYSVFAKKNTLDYISLYANDDSNARVWFNLADGTLGNQEAGGLGSIESYGNGWYRCTMTWNSSNLVNVRIYNSNENDIVGGTAGSVYIQYAQLEQGSYATSLINTQGTVQTRLADSCSQTPPDGVIGQTEGTMYAEAKINGLKDSNTIFTLHNGSFSEYLVIAGNSSGNITAYIFAGGVQQAAIFGGIYAVGSIVKCAMAYKQNDVAFYINGVLIGTDTSATMASTSVFDVGSISFGNYPLNGSVKQAQLYNTRLSNSELQALTQV